MRYKIVRTIKRSKCPIWTKYFLYSIDPVVYETVSSFKAAKQNLESIADIVKGFKVLAKKSSIGNTDVLSFAKLVKKDDTLELRSVSNTLYVKFKIIQYE